MTNITFDTEILKKALDAYGKAHNVHVNGNKKTAIALHSSNSDLLKYLETCPFVTKAQSTRIHKFLHAPDEFKTKKYKSPRELADDLYAIQDAAETPVFEANIGGKWYPVLFYTDSFRTFGGSFVTGIMVYGNIGNLQYSDGVYLSEENFMDNHENVVPKTIEELLKNTKIRFTTPEAVKHSIALAKKVEEIAASDGKMFDAVNQALQYHNWFGWQEFPLGSKGSGSHVIVESSLEGGQGRAHSYYSRNGEWRLPFVRVFSLKHKGYMYVDVDDLHTHVFHRDGKEKIVLPKTLMTALNSVFDAKPEQIFGDAFNGRHGGIVVMANGSPGIGKTLTAEVFAEYQERPLYSMEMGEIGTTLKDVEASLQRIFARAKKWNAVLLFDEADIFLSERVSSDLERSAIVGVFLRLLDYYEGTFFLTTNRGDSIDPALKSRVTLYLNYPNLTDESRLKIWRNMITASGLEVTEDVPMANVASFPLNGRQIRNQVRLLGLMYPDKKVSVSQIIESLEFVVR